MSAPRSGGWTAGIAALLHVNALGLVVLAALGLEAGGVPMFAKMGAGVVAGAAGAAIAVLVAVVGLSGLVTAPLLALLIRRRAPERAWRAAGFAVAIALAPSLLNFPMGNVGLGLAALLGMGVAAVIGALPEPKRPGTLVAALPVLALAGWFVVSTVQSVQSSAESYAYDRVNEVGDVAESGDAGALAKTLDHFDLSPKLGDFDQSLHQLALRGDHLAAMEQIVRHPKTPATGCVKVLRAVLAGDAAAFDAVTLEMRADPYREFCTITAAYLAARERQGGLLAKLVSWLDAGQRIDDVLRALLRSNDLKAAVLLLRSMDALDDGGRMRWSLYEEPTLHSLVQGADDRSFFYAHGDPDALLVLLAGTSGYEQYSREALDAGAHPNARMPCGATPLTAALQKFRDSDLVAMLLDAGADPNAPGAGFCFVTDAGPQEPPLWVLAHAMKGDSSSNTRDSIRLLVRRGAKTSVKSAEGQTLSEAFNPSLHRALDGGDEDEGY